MKNCFVIMPFTKEFDKVYNRAVIPAFKSLNCQVIRADEQNESVIIDGIISGIKNANICLADLTGFNKNVLYEIGISHSANTPTILITQDNPEQLPFDLKHYRVITYKLNKFNKLQKKIIEIARTLIDLEEIPLQLIQEMLIPNSLEKNQTNNPFVIACCPLSWRVARQKEGGFKKLKKTYGDHIGVRGIIQSFGLIKGLETLPELINTGDFIEEIALNKANIYCIASPKANHWTNILLKKFCENKKPTFSFKADVKSKNLRDVHVNIHKNNGIYFPAEWDEDTHRYKKDFGLVVRGPHPMHPECMIMILAGRGSIGTEAACHAVTDAGFIKRIKDRLAIDHVNFNNHHNAFWAIVSLNARYEEEREVDIDSFEVIDSRAFKIKN